MKTTRTALLVLTTIDDVEIADRIARTLIEEGLAACVSRSPVRSTYRWKGAIETAAEELLLIKTASDLRERLCERLTALHPYEVPELAAIEPTAVEAPYLDWLLAACPPPA